MSSLVMRRLDLENLPEPEPFATSKTILRAFHGETMSEAEKVALTDLLKAAFADNNWTLPRLDKELVGDPNVKTIFVIEEGGAFVATASVLLAPETMPQTGIVHWVGAHPDYRGRRLGYHATLATLQEFRLLGCANALLRTDEYRLPAIRTYQRLGFVPDYTQPVDAARWETVHQQLKRGELPTAKGFSE